MREVTKNTIIQALVELGIEPGDGLLVHSAIQFLGRPLGGAGMYLDAIQAVISPAAAAGSSLDRGTLAVPTFNFSFARGERYDPQMTPSQGMGAFSEYVRQRPEALRTTHPMQSLAVIGRYAEDLAQRDMPSAFDPGSAFERIVELDFKLLLLGAHISAASIFHLSEYRCRVPYRYWKDFQGQIKTPEGWQTRTYRMYVRDLDIQPELTANPVQELLEARGQWRSRALNYGQIAACRLQDFVSAVDHFLTADPWSLVISTKSSRDGTASHIGENQAP